MQVKKELLVLIALPFLLLAAVKETGSGSTLQERRVARGRETVRDCDLA
jgi:hypothetical protein